MKMWEKKNDYIFVYNLSLFKYYKTAYGLADVDAMLGR